MNAQHLSSRKNGFTLIELLVVVSIIALLIAILLPSLRSARDQAKKTKCMSNLHSIGLALFGYANDNRQELPGYSTMGRWGFRVAPGERTDPTAPPEAWGVQSILEAGTSPEILLSGLARRIPVTESVYLDGHSDVWKCPANPGLYKRESEWKGWGNSYYYLTRKSQDEAVVEEHEWDPEAGGEQQEEDPVPQRNKRAYSLDYLASSKAGHKFPIIWDNYIYYPGESGFMGPFQGDGYRVDGDHRTPPHRVLGQGKRGAGNFWIAFFARGHCEINYKNRS